MPSPTVNTKLANAEIAAMFDQTLHRGKVQDDSDSDSDSDAEEDEEEDIMEPDLAPTPLPSRAGLSMMPAHSMAVPPTPTPAQGHRPQLVFQDENAGSSSKPAAPLNIFATPAKTPARAPLSAATPRPVQSTPAPRSTFNVFTPVPALQAPAQRNVFSNAIAEQDEEEQDEQYDENYNPRQVYRSRVGNCNEMTPITERTQEYTQMTNLRSSQSTNVFSVSSGRRSSVQSIYPDNENIPSEAVNKGLSAVYEEEERSSQRESSPYDESQSQHGVSDYQHLEESDHLAPAFEVPEGFTIHSRPQDPTMEGQQDTMHTAREGSIEPEAESDTGAFVTANHGPISSADALSNPCVPIDEDVISTLLAKIQPPLSSLPHFSDMRHTTSNRLASLNSHTKVKARRSSAAAPRPSVSADDRVSITLGSREFEVADKIGEGGFGAVFLAVDVRLKEQIEDADSDDEDEDDEVDRSLVAIKVEKPGAVWEAVILDRILSRVDQPMSIIRPRELIAFADESYLVLDFAPQGTLLDAVNKASSMGIAPATAGGPSALDELVAIFFAIELLRVIESLHRSQFIHGDMKIDNCLVRLDAIPSADGGNSGWSNQYSAQGENGWRHKGMKLIDFGRGIDLSLFPAGEKQKFKADWKVDERDCVEMRGGREWSYETDYFGLASICYCMLFGKYISTEVTTSTEGGKWHKIDTPLKRVSLPILQVFPFLTSSTGNPIYGIVYSIPF
jgi:checkpoint serine/threonine-protein kinase